MEIEGAIQGAQRRLAEPQTRGKNMSAKIKGTVIPGTSKSVWQLMAETPDIELLQKMETLLAEESTTDEERDQQTRITDGDLVHG